MVLFEIPERLPNVIHTCMQRTGEIKSTDDINNEASVLHTNSKAEKKASLKKKKKKKANFKSAWSQPQISWDYCFHANQYHNSYKNLGNSTTYIVSLPSSINYERGQLFLEKVSTDQQTQNRLFPLHQLHQSRGFFCLFNSFLQYLKHVE